MRKTRFQILAHLNISFFTCNMGIKMFLCKVVVKIIHVKKTTQSVTNNLKQLLRAYLGVILSLGLFCINRYSSGNVYGEKENLC